MFMWCTSTSASGILETLEVVEFHLFVDTGMEGQRG